MDEDRVMFGNVDAWIIWNLTGAASGNGVHVTDVTNASRTMLMDLQVKKQTKNGTFKQSFLMTSCYFGIFLTYTASPSVTLLL